MVRCSDIQQTTRHFIPILVTTVDHHERETIFKMISLALNKRTLTAKSVFFQESQLVRHLHYLLGCPSLSASKTFLTDRGRWLGGGEIRKPKEFRQTHEEKEIDYILV